MRSVEEDSSLSGLVIIGVVSKGADFVGVSLFSGKGCNRDILGNLAVRGGKPPGKEGMALHFGTGNWDGALRCAS